MPTERILAELALMFVAAKVAGALFQRLRATRAGVEGIGS